MGAANLSYAKCSQLHILTAAGKAASRLRARAPGHATAAIGALRGRQPSWLAIYPKLQMSYGMSVVRLRPASAISKGLERLLRRWEPR